MIHLLARTLVDKFKGRIFNEVYRFGLWFKKVESTDEGKTVANTIKTTKFSLNIMMVKNIVMFILIASKFLEKQLRRSIALIIFMGLVRPKNRRIMQQKI